MLAKKAWLTLAPGGMPHLHAPLAAELERTQGFSAVLGSVWSYGERIDKLPVLVGGLVGIPIAVWLAPRRSLAPLAMFAVLVGSAETVTSEARDSLESVVIHSKSNKYLIVHAGRKALLVMRLPPSAEAQKTKIAVEKYIPRIEEHL